MKSILVVYGTTDGQTRKIAKFTAEILRQSGLVVELVDSGAKDAAWVQPVFASAIVCASLHQDRYQASIRRFLLDNKSWLLSIPTAFVSVSLTAAFKDEPGLGELGEVTNAFYDEVAWQPGLTYYAAGALRYSQYDYFKRLLINLIARRQRGNLDTSRDSEYTDWDALRRFIHEFRDAVEPGSVSTLPTGASATATFGMPPLNLAQSIGHLRKNGDSA